MKKRVGEMIEVKDRRGKVAFLFDTANVPSRNASLKTRSSFAVAYLQRSLDGKPMSLKTFKICIAWMAEAVAEWGGASDVEKRVRRAS